VRRRRIRSAGRDRPPGPFRTHPGAAPGQSSPCRSGQTADRAGAKLDGRAHAEPGKFTGAARDRHTEQPAANPEPVRCASNAARNCSG